MPSVGQILLGFIGITIPIGAFTADFFSTTHIYNPRWPPHAKFHTGQTLSFAVVLGFSTLYYLFVPHGANGLNAAAQLAIKRQRLDFVALLASMYWITQAAAIFYPECKCIDPEFGEGCPQAIIDSVYLSVVLVGYLLERRRVTAEAQNKAK